MDKSNGKVIAIVALVVAVIALSAGFAAFTAVLNITNATATVTASDTFAPNVNYQSTNGVSPKCYPTGNSSGTVDGVSEGNLSGKTWSDITIPLSSTVTSVTCQATVSNASGFTAFLTSIEASGTLTCASAQSGSSAASSSSITSVCGGTKMQVHIDNATYASATDKLEITDSTQQANLSANGSTSINANGTQTVYVTVSTNAAAAADGDILVDLPDITLTYKTVGNSSGN